MQVGRVIEKKKNSCKGELSHYKGKLKFAFNLRNRRRGESGEWKSGKKGQSKLKSCFYVKTVNVAKLGSVIVERFINTGFAFSKLSKKALFPILCQKLSFQLFISHSRSPYGV